MHKLKNLINKHSLFTSAEVLEALKEKNAENEYTSEQINEALGSLSASDLVRSMLQDVVIKSSDVCDDTVIFFRNVIKVVYEDGVKTLYIKVSAAKGDIWVPTLFGHTVKDPKAIQTAYVTAASSYISPKQAMEHFESINEELKKVITLSELGGASFFNSSKYLVYTPEKIDATTNKATPAKVVYKQVNIDKYLTENTDVTDSSKLISNGVKDFTNDPTVPAINYFSINKDRVVPKDSFKLIDGWADNLIKTGYRDAFEKYIASVFVASNNGRQAMYLYDSNGASLKSKIISAILKYAGKSMAIGVSEKNLVSRFGIPPIIGKRLLTIGDNKNQKLISEGVIHNILGGDSVQAEYKGGVTKSVTIHCKIIAASNSKPEVSDNIHEQSRLLLIEMVKPSVNSSYMKEVCFVDDNGSVMIDSVGSPMFKNSNDIGAILDEQMPHFIEYCISKHYDYVSTHSNVELSEVMTANIRLDATPFVDFTRLFVKAMKPTGGKGICPITINNMVQLVAGNLGENKRFSTGELKKAITNQTKFKVGKFKSVKSVGYTGKTTDSTNVYMNVAFDYQEIVRILSQYVGVGGVDVNVADCITDIDLECINTPNALTSYFNNGVF